MNGVLFGKSMAASKELIDTIHLDAPDLRVALARHTISRISAASMVFRNSRGPWHFKHLKWLSLCQPALGFSLSPSCALMMQQRLGL